MKLIYILLLLSFQSILAQSVIDQIDDNRSKAIAKLDLPTEKIEKVGVSGTILIITNSSSSFNKGDFISLVFDNNLVNRAIVAKVDGGSAGIKIVKVYSNQYHKILSPGRSVKIIRGDDSFFANLKNQKDSDKKSLIDDEDDLFNDTTLLSDDIDLDENTKRLIRTDWIAFAMGSSISSVDVKGSAKRYSQLGASFAYQFKDNAWLEGSYNINNLTNFPRANENVSLNNIIVRAKYTIAMPGFSYLKPYIGFQMITATSSIKDPTDEEALQLDRLPKSQVVFGASILKRLVPGWFLRADVGTDLIALGLGIEF